MPESLGETPVSERSTECRVYLRNKAKRTLDGSTKAYIEEVMIPGIPHLIAFEEGWSAPETLNKAKTNAYRLNGPFAAIVSNSIFGTEYWADICRRFPVRIVIQGRGRPRELGAEHKGHKGISAVVIDPAVAPSPDGTYLFKQL